MDVVLVQNRAAGGGSGGNNGISAIIKNKVISILKNNKKCADFIGGTRRANLSKRTLFTAMSLVDGILMRTECRR